MDDRAAVAKKNPLPELARLGQSVWLDRLRRGSIASGELRRLVEEDGLRGAAFDPAFFATVLASGADYGAALAALEPDNLDAARAYERLALRDVQDAADALRPVYEGTRRRDGFVSFPVAPALAQDRGGMVGEALRLWRTAGRENLMLRVPGTEAGIGALEDLVAEGVSVHVALLFSRRAYEAAAWAFVAGLEKLVAKGRDAGRVASVAGFCVGPVGAAVDGLLAGRLEAASKPGERAALRALMGKAAVANAKLAYTVYKEVARSARWRALAVKGAKTQRLMWSGTSCGDAARGEASVIEELIGPDTVDAMSPAALDAFRRAGQAGPTLASDLAAARDALKKLERLGLPLERVTDKALKDGVRLLVEQHERALAAVDAARRAAPAAPGRQTWTLPPALARAVEEALEDWRAHGKVRRLWARDPSLWTGAGDARLGWLGAPDSQADRLEELQALRESFRKEGLRQVVLLGPGGCGSAAAVFARAFGRVEGHPELVVLDSADPARVRAVEARLDWARSVVIVCSKSGCGLELDALAGRFLAGARAALGAEKAGRRFVAITDPGSRLEQLADKEGFRRVFHGGPDVGGRCSALSDFGLVPAAAMGLDPARLLGPAQEMAAAASGCVPPERNPAVRLGALLGAAARLGRDKATLVASPGLEAFGAWLEQLLGGSAGQDGEGIVPVHREPLGPPVSYGDDRLFVYLRLDSAPDAAQDAAVALLEASGQPVARLGVAGPYELGREFFRWQLAAAVAGSVLGAAPFGRLDGEAGQVAARRLADRCEKTGTLPPETPFYADGVKLFAEEARARSLLDLAGRPVTLSGVLRAHLAGLQPGDHFAMQAYLETTAAHDEALTSIRVAVRDAARAATSVGFEPLSLHAAGLFIQLTCDDAEDLAVPGRKATLGTVKAARARGDFDALVDRGCRALRVHLGRDVAAGLETLRRAVETALAERR